MKRTNTPSDALNRNKAVIDVGDGLPPVELPLDGNFGGTKGDPGEGVPTGGAPLQVVRKNVAGTTTEWATLTKDSVGLSSVDNTADADKPISAATQIALDEKAGKAELDAKPSLDQIPPVIADQAVQADYVGLLDSKSPMNGVQVLKTDSGESLQIVSHSPNGDFTAHLIEGNTATSARDDYRIVGDIYAGKLPAKEVDYSALTTTGTFVATSEQYGYTTQVGAKWSVLVDVPFKGAEIRVHPYKDNRGGMWRYSIGGHVTEFSTYSAASSRENNGQLVSSPEVSAGSQLLTAEFIGADPANPPSGGTARGWLARTPGTNQYPGQYTLIQYPDISGGWAQGTKQGIESNREFAWWIKRAGTEQTARWVPYHTAQTAFNAEAPRFYDGNRELSISWLQVGQPYDATGPVSIVQHVYGRNPDEPSVNLLDIWTTTTIHPSGRLTIEGKIRVNFDIQVTNTYVLMNPVNSAVFDTVISPIGNSYPNTVAQEGTNTNLPESDWGTSWAFLSSASPDNVAAFRYNNPAETTRRGQPGKNPEGTRAWLEHRTGGQILKHYQKLWATNEVVPAGTVHRFSGDYIHQLRPNAYQEFST